MSAGAVAGDTRGGETRVGVLQARDERPPVVMHMVRLYKGDLLFRSLVDLAVVGLLVVLATIDWREAGKLAARTYGELRASVAAPAEKEAKHTLQRLTDRSGAGADVIAAIGPPAIERDALRQAGEPLAAHLEAIAAALEKGNVAAAAQLVSVLDDRDPTVAYAKAVVTLHEGGGGRAADARRLLRRATEQAVYPAYVLMGEVLFRLVQLDERGDLPASERVAIDDVGTAHPASRAELAAETVLWWERAAGFGRPLGLRLLGMAKARGLAGKPDLVGAAAIWRNAAERGDDVSQLELGKMLLLGEGVQPDATEAIQLFRLAADRLPLAAIGLATALTPRAIAGDAAAAREAIGTLEALLDRTSNRAELGFSYFLLGQYYFQAAPPELRNPARALKAWERATKLGSRDAALLAAEAYRVGTGISRDLPCAYGFYLQAKPSEPGRIDPILTELRQQIGPEGIERGKSIAFALTPPLVGGTFPAVNSSLRPNEPKPAPPQESASLAAKPVCEQISAGSREMSFEEVMSTLRRGSK
ncbi:MAG: hypothetical protein C5B56_09180 [Proteobacteria bacterium]|nr:MAG: hypothetical protein C5B56_09180 [Pseudomonadota bacterium]